MSAVTQPLVNYLGSQNPILDVSKCPPGKNTTSIKNPWTIPHSIKTWDDFEYDALRTIYGGLLCEVLGCQFTIEPTTVPHVPFCQIHDEPSFESLVTRWNQTVVLKALDSSQRYLEDRLPVEKIYMCLGGQAQRPRPTRYPDWGAIMPSTVPADKAGAKSRNFLPGDTKVISKWTSAKIMPGVVKESKKKVDWMQPIGQIYTYCVRVNARYGYIITDEELVVLRIRPSIESNSESPVFEDLERLKTLDPKINLQNLKAMSLTNETPAGRAETNGILEFKAIPWASHFQDPHAACGIMTVNLALWWLHMMAAENNCIEERYPPLGEAVYAPRPQTQPTSFASSDRSKKGRPLSKKTHNHRVDTPTLNPKRGDRKRLREKLGDTSRTKQRASPPKRRTRRHA